MHFGSVALMDVVSGQLAEGYSLWESSKLSPPPTSERYVIADVMLSEYQGEGAANLAAACQCFWMFRSLHRLTEVDPVNATLLGDYFFSVFSKNLIPLDSVALNGEFARFLAGDVQAPVGLSGYLEFVRDLPAVLI